MKRNKNTKPFNKQRPIILAVLVVAILLCAAGIYSINKQSEPNQTIAAKSGPTINYRPATTEEKKESEARKDALIEARNKQQQASDEPTASGKKSVTPVITLAQYAGSVAEIRSFVPNIYEEDGTCTVTLAQEGRQAIIKQSPATPNASTTDCRPFTIDRAEFSATGSWDVTISYSSSVSEGKSTQKSSVEVK